MLPKCKLQDNNHVYAFLSKETLSNLRLIVHYCVSMYEFHQYQANLVKLNVKVKIVGLIESLKSKPIVLANSLN